MEEEPLQSPAAPPRTLASWHVLDTRIEPAGGEETLEKAAGIPGLYAARLCSPSLLEKTREQGRVSGIKYRLPRAPHQPSGRTPLFLGSLASRFPSLPPFLFGPLPRPRVGRRKLSAGVVPLPIFWILGTSLSAYCRVFSWLRREVQIRNEESQGPLDILELALHREGNETPTTSEKSLFGK